MSNFFGSSGERFEISLENGSSNNSNKTGSDHDDDDQQLINTLDTMQLQASHSELADNSSSAATDQVNSKEIINSTKSAGPIVVLVIGMAGTGKTTLMHRINLYMNEQKLRGYYINLDPAVKSTPFAANIDIRDTVNYKEVMAQYGLGPNGGILTSLNLFATRFDQVIGILERRANIAATSGDASQGLDYIFIDTPGQIEAFTWSAGGQIIQELLGSSFPTCVLYVVDTTRCVSPTTFMSNMLYACSVLYKARLPMICCFNKVDVTSYEFAKGWMDDFEKYLQAVDDDEEEYMGSFNRSLALAMDEFYSNITTVGISAATGFGISELFAKIEQAGLEFQETYLPDLMKRMEDKQKADEVRQATDLNRLKQDFAKTRGDVPIDD